eukprot:5049699-Prymnesium_polylepis.2
MTETGRVESLGHAFAPRVIQVLQNLASRHLASQSTCPVIPRALLTESERPSWSRSDHVGERRGVYSPCSRPNRRAKNPERAGARPRKHFFVVAHAGGTN